MIGWKWIYYEVEGVRPRGKPNETWSRVLHRDNILSPPHPIMLFPTPSPPLLSPSRPHLQHMPITFDPIFMQIFAFLFLASCHSQIALQWWIFLYRKINGYQCTVFLHCVLSMWHQWSTELLVQRFQSNLLHPFPRYYHDNCSHTNSMPVHCILLPQLLSPHSWSPQISRCPHPHAAV